MILRRVWMFLNVDILYSVLSVVNSVLTVRLMGASLFGQLSYLLAILALTPSFYSVFDNTLIRFMGTLAPRRQRRLLLFVLACKTAAMILSMAGVAGWYFLGNDRAFTEVLSNPYMLAFGICVWVTLPMELVSRSLEAVMQSLEMYRKTIYIRVSQAASLLLVNLALWAAATRGQDVLLWRGGHQVLSGLSLLAFTVIALRKAGWWSALRATGRTDNARDFAFSYRNYFRPYSQPLAVGLLFEYAKNHLPSLLLAHTTSYETVSYYKVFRNLFEISKKTLPKIANTLLPSVVKLKASNPRFAAKYTRYSQLYMILIGAVALGIFLFHSLILRIYKLEAGYDASWTALLFSLCLLVATFGFILNYLILLEKDTTPQYYISSVGGVSYIALLFAFMRFGIIGVTAALLVKGVINNFQYQYYVVHRYRYMTISQFGVLTGILAGFGLLILGSAAFMPGNLLH